jgi:threonine/homoserine/homoserine lactone efflux protein
VGGLVLGYAGMTAVVAAGVGALIAESPEALTTLTVLGGGYLMCHGAWTLAAPSAPATPTTATATSTATAAAEAETETETEAETPVRTGWATLAQGAGVSGLNPKGLLIFVALLPQFTSPGRAWPMAVQMSALGLVFVCTCAAFYLALGSVARTVLHSRPAAARAVNRLSGTGMIIVGAFLIIGRLT